MRTFSGKRSTLALAIAGITAMSGWIVVPQAQASGFFDDSTLTGGIYYWQRERDRKDVTDGDKYKTNLSHATWNANLDFQSGYAADMFGLDIAAFTAIEMAENGDSGHPNEIAFSKKNKGYDEDYSGDKSGISLYKAAAKFKYGPVWARAGYIQPTGQTLLAPHWSFMPGTYQGAEAGASFDYGDAGALSFSYMWTNEYKAPWHTEMDKFYQADKNQCRLSPLHRREVRLQNDLVLEAAFGQSEGYVDQYFAKASYKFDLGGNPFTTSYRFYGARDKVDDRSVNDIYDGTAWLQALTFGYKVAEVVDLRLEGTWVKADGQQGYFLQRMTPTYASSNGRLDIWWDNRSDFNANGEKAVFFGAMYDLKTGICRAGLWARLTFTPGMPNRQPGKVTRMLTTTKTALSKSPHTVWMRFIPCRRGVPKAPCSSCTSPNMTTTPIFQAGAVVTATSSRMSVT